MSDLLRSTLQQSLGQFYTLERELTGGGMSRVFVARDERLGRDVVVKLLAPELAASVSADRFAREIKLAAALQEPHILPVLSAGETTDGTPYYTMPLVRGESLRRRIQRGAIPLEESVAILKDVARGLAYAHRQGIVHRDIKPENVLLSEGTAVVADFGIAKALDASRDTGAASAGGTLTLIGTSLGTPAYMAPEQAIGDATADHRADLYSWGIMAYELLAGAHPFEGKTTAQQLITAHLGETPPRLATRALPIPDRLASLVEQCVQKDPAKRPSSADEVLARLDDLGAVTRKRAPGRRAAVFIGAAALVVIVLAGVMVARLRGGAAAPDAVRVETLAVLPLTNEGGDTANAYFAAGMTDEVTAALAKLPGVRVASRSAVSALAGRGLGAREAGRQLGVGAVLEGSVRRWQDRLRITVQLVSTADGLTLWADSFERQVGDVFAVQDDISHAIARAMHVRSSPTEPLVRVATRSSAAYDLYLRGRFHFNEFTERDLHRSIELFEQAVAADSSFALAWSGVADSWAALADDWLPPSEAYPRAEQAARRALAIDSTLERAHISLGVVLLSYHWDFAGAERAFRRAATLNVSDPAPHAQLSSLYQRTGRNVEALAQIDTAARDDPQTGTYVFLHAAAMLWSRRYDAAIAEGTRAVGQFADRGGTSIVIGEAYLAQRKPAEALAAFERARKLGYVRAPEAVARARVAAGDRDAGRRALSELRAERTRRYVRPEQLARLHLALGDTAQALDWLDSALVMRSSGATWLAAHPAYDPLRGHPRFRAMIARVGLR